MASPGYAPEREFIIEAPDGTFAAFTVTWHDRLNRTGLFEPVGTHKDHTRRGLGRALVLYGMRQMAGVGLEFASVVNESNNEASRELYKACGFKPWHELDGYSKSVSPSHADLV
jgi:ribosomal protein S18 acetylase RimI-like enzyme